ncbi:MAG: Mur ligase family protein [Phycisphaerales bacterium]|nr:Mur ligase family protein [Phycisphaerales bacterium]
MNYQETLTFLNSFPNFISDGALAYKKGLDNIKKISTYLGNPQDKYPCIHIAGTNGKGSVSHILSAIFQIAGYKVGLHTSPHIKDIRERFKINGHYCSRDFLIKFADSHHDFLKSINPSFFEVTVAMALELFATEQVDIAIIETGLGGTYDSTNIVKPLCSVITNVSFDHQEILGETLGAIAKEKAGIIKEQTPVVIGTDTPTTKLVFINKAQMVQAPLYFSSDLFRVLEHRLTESGMDLTIIEKDTQHYYGYHSDLGAHYQINNITTALSVINVLRKHELIEQLTKEPEVIGKETDTSLGNHSTVRANSTLTPPYKNRREHKYPHQDNIKKKLIVEEVDIDLALQQIYTTTNFQGRWQTLRESPKTIIDVGHNTAGWLAIIKQINQLPYRNWHIIVAVSKDKSIHDMLSLLPKKAYYYFTQYPSPRSLTCSALKEKAQLYQLQGADFNNVNEALEVATHNCQPQEAILIMGSLYLMGDIFMEDGIEIK